MITVNKANPTPGEITSSLTGSTGDGAGLHFESGGYVELANSAAAEFGTSDFSVEFVLNQKEANVSSNNIFRYPNGGDNRVFIESVSGTTKITFRDTGNAVYDLGYDMSADYGMPTHYVLTADRDGNAVLYKNGNQVGSVDISASSSVNIGSGNTGVGAIGSSSANYTMLGTFYRFRTWNKLLSSAEVQTALERADVPVADQYGSPTSKILNGTSWTSASGTTPPASWTAGSGQVPNFTIDSSSGSGSEPALKFQRGANNMPYFFQTFTAVIGKKYRVAYRIKNIDAIHVRVGIGSSAVGTQYNVTDYTSTDWADYEDTFTATTTTFSIYVQANTVTGTQGGYIDSVTVEQVGCVSDYELSANPTQSLTVQDRSGTADGTASASGVTQVQPIVQGNMRSLAVTTSQQAAGVPADGDLLVGGNVDISAANAAVTLGSTAGNGSPSLKLCEQVQSGDIHNGFSFNVDGDGTNNLHVKRHVTSSSGADVLVLDRDSGLATFSNGITVSGGFLNIGSFSSLNISSGAITVTSSMHQVDSEGGSGADTLHTINGGTTGDIIVLRSDSAANDITLTNVSGGTGNLRLNGEADIVLGSNVDTVTLIKDGSEYKEISHSTIS